MKNYLLKLADDTLIMGQRLAEWCGKGPYLEEDIALTNIALDYLGQSNHLYSYASELNGNGKTPDDLAFLRYENQYLNAQFVELPNGDYAQTILKVYFFALYQKELYTALLSSEDASLAGIAEKSLKEVRYHYSHARMWLEIMQQGTSESKKRLAQALENLWEYTGGLFDETQGEQNLSDLNLAADRHKLKSNWSLELAKDFSTLGLEVPENEFMQKGSRKGVHTEHFGYILCELQYMQRAYPGCEW
ncbi:1,2-phenylacetyl-CoA epoxidase subunit PaaC [Chryseobacterium sp. A321]